MWYMIKEYKRLFFSRPLVISSMLLFFCAGWTHGQHPADSLGYQYYSALDRLHRSHVDSAEHYGLMAIQWARDNNDPGLQIMIAAKLSDMYFYNNEREKAFEYLTGALDICDAYELEYDKIEILYALGLHFSRSSRRGNDQTIDTSKLWTAISYHQRAIALAKKYDDAILISKGYNLSGMCYDRLDENEKSMESYRISEEYSRQADDSVGLGYTLDYAGGLYAKMERFDEAEKMLKEALAIRERLGDSFSYAINLNNMGEFYRQRKQTEKAISYLEQSLVISMDINFNDLAMHTMGLLSGLYLESGRYKEAYELKEKEVAIKDKQFGIDRAKVLDELETKYQSELKDRLLAEQELDLLEKQSSLQRSFYFISLFAVLTIALVIIILLLRSRFRKKQSLLEREREIAVKEAQINAALESQEIERKRFAQDLHDGFGQLISSLRLFMHQLEQNTDIVQKAKAFEQSEKVLEEMHREIRNIAFNLMPATLIQSGLPAAVGEFSQRINQSDKVRMHLDIDGLNERLTELQEISVYRILQEWVNNILKYAEADTIDIQLVKDENELLLMIEDNGRGFDVQRLINSKGNGWRNIQSRARRIEAEVEIDSREGVKGTVFQLICKLIATKDVQIPAEPERAEA